MRAHPNPEGTTIETLPPLTPHGWLRWDIVSRVLEQTPPGAAVLEVGAGQGAVACRLAQRFRYTGVEPDAASRTVARERLSKLGGEAVMQAAIDDLAEDAKFDVVCAFEVLEHIKDDDAALRQWVRHLDRGGLLVLSVPMHQHRFGPSDVHVGHYRRYGREQLAERLDAVGLEDHVLITYGLPLGHLLERARNEVVRRRAGQERMSDRTAASGRLLQPDGRIGVLTRVATAPFRVAQRPFRDTALGTGLVAAAHHPG